MWDSMLKKLQAESIQKETYTVAKDKRHARRNLGGMTGSDYSQLCSCHPSQLGAEPLCMPVRVWASGLTMGPET
jgi:hypothetical protein